MDTVLIACEVMRQELEMLAADMPAPPAMTFLEQGLHNYPNKLRDAVQTCLDSCENAHPGPLTVLCGFGLCGRGLCEVRARTATLVFPRVHDCIPLLLGVDRQETPLLDGTTYWMSPGWLTYVLIPFHLETHKRLARYTAKFGPVKAARMVQAENRLLAAYTNVCHVRWPEMGDAYVDAARQVAAAVGLPYTERRGSSGYLRELLRGGQSKERFIHLAPGESLDMDTRGAICASRTAR